MFSPFISASDSDLRRAKRCPLGSANISVSRPQWRLDNRRSSIFWWVMISWYSSSSSFSDRLSPSSVVVCRLVAHRLPVPVVEFLERFRFETEYFYFILIGTQQWNAALQQQAEALEVTPVYWRTVQIAGMDSSVVGKQLQSLRQDLKQYRHCLLVTSAAQPDEQDESPIVLRLCVSAVCIGCGICERICPRGCYTLLHQRSHRDPRRCVGCLACVHGCPMNALQPEAKWRSETA